MYLKPNLHVAILCLPGRFQRKVRISQLLSYLPTLRENIGEVSVRNLHNHKAAHIGNDR